MFRPDGIKSIVEPVNLSILAILDISQSKHLRLLEMPKPANIPGLVGWATRLHGQYHFHDSQARCPRCRSYEKVAVRVGKIATESRTVGWVAAYDFAHP